MKIHKCRHVGLNDFIEFSHATNLVQTRRPLCNISYKKKARILGPFFEYRLSLLLCVGGHTRACSADKWNCIVVSIVDGDEVSLVIDAAHAREGYLT